MEKRYKDILRPLVAELRRTLAGAADGSTRGDLDRELERLGIAPDGTIAMVDVASNPAAAERRARAVAAAELGAVADVKERVAARAAFVERAAYGWINRLLALRVLEARGLIDETLRSNPDYEGLSEALYVLRQSDPARTSGPDGGWWAVIEDACAAQAAALPGLFGLETPSGASSSALYDPAITLRPSTTALLRCVELLGGPPTSTPTEQVAQALGAMDVAFADPDAIGWAYQFYQEEAKAQVYARLKSGKKVATRDEIAAATQLFTEPYMVKWLLQNSLGRSYQETFPQSALPATWEYYIRPEQLDAPAFPVLESLTLLDPCMGSGHFLREAFDMLVAMYREQQPELDAITIADRILAQHLHGIDIDPRAAQLAAFTLYARAWELVRDERRARKQPGPGSYMPAALNLATTPGHIAPGALARHLQRHPADRPFEPLLTGVFAALENADILGSLLRPREHLATAIAKLRRPRQLPMQADSDLQMVQEAIENVLHTDPSRLEEMLLERVASSFAAEAGGADDVAAALFGRAAERGVRLLQLLDRQYAVVVTNPPYMRSDSMGFSLKRYLEVHYRTGKRDLYSSFILRCVELCHPSGCVSMITQQSWMFIRSFKEFRISSELNGNPTETPKGIVNEVTIQLLVHLGTRAFSEISGEVVSCVMFMLRNDTCQDEHKLHAISLVDLSTDAEKSKALRSVTSNAILVAARSFHPRQSLFRMLPEAPIVYNMPDEVNRIFSLPKRIKDVAVIESGLKSGNNDRWVKYRWEVEASDRWAPLMKGGPYARWIADVSTAVDWRQGVQSIYMADKIARVSGIHRYFTEGISFNLINTNGLSGKYLPSGCIFNNATPTIFANGKSHRSFLCCALNSALFRYVSSSLNPTLNYGVGDAESLPVPSRDLSPFTDVFQSVYEVARAIRRDTSTLEDGDVDYIQMSLVKCLLEGQNNELIYDAFDIPGHIRVSLNTSCHIPTQYCAIQGFTSLPVFETSIQHTLLWPLEITPAAEERVLSAEEIASLKKRARALYEAGYQMSEGSDESPTAAEESQEDETDDGHISNARITMPTETLLEDLSVRLQVHPISVYWLLQEIRAEGARCKPEEQRLLEDRLSVIVLRLLGHRWPKQLESGEPVPEWADHDGIIPLVAGSGEAPLAERVRERLRAEDGDLGAQQAEALLAELSGRSLEEWLRRDFFPRHVRQFKSRPIAWHLASTPQTAGASGAGGRGRGGARQAPAFECLVYYHATGAGLLARIRTQYVEPLLYAERGRASAARQAGDDTTAAQANARVRELEGFTERLRGIEEQGFACAELNAVIAREPLDRWSGDGILPPSSHDALLAQEQAWMVDINDGVRVNIAPVQLAGVLASSVLKEPDARKAIADRARWRADERRWVREGILPRCGWMAEDVPESSRWTERALEREAERTRLKAKRAEALRKLEGATG